MSLREMLERMERTRVGGEAADLVWGNLSGVAATRTVLTIVCSSLVFAAAAGVFLLLPAAGRYEPCRNLLASPAPVCRAQLLQALIAFGPSLLVLAAGSYLFVRSQKGRRFQASALSTAVLLLYSGVSLARLGIGGLLLAGVLFAVFLSAYAGYRLALR